MNKKKIAALVLLGAILFGGAGFGAYSWFTSSANVKANLVVKTGTLKVTADNPNWACMVEDTESKIENNKVTNARPGDYFYKVVTIKNDGTLAERVNLTVNNKVIPEYSKAIKVTVGEEEIGGKLEDIKTIVLKPKEFKHIRIVVGLDEKGMDNTYNGTLKGKDIELSKVLNADNIIIANAQQLNYPNTTVENKEKVNK